MFRNVYINKAKKLSANKNTFMSCYPLLKKILDEGYRYILISRFQSDPSERRFGQYRQVSG